MAHSTLPGVVQVGTMRNATRPTSRTMLTTMIATKGAVVIRNSIVAATSGSIFSESLAVDCIVTTGHVSGH